MSRRDFCVMAGSGLVTLGLAACAPPEPRVMVGDGIDNSNSTHPTTSGGPPVQDAGGPGADLLPNVHDGGSSDLAQTTASCASGSLAAGPASAVAVGDAKLLTGSGYQLFLCRDSAGLYALDAACTHEGKLLQKQATSFYCSKHGARFNLNGEFPTLPAFFPLAHYAVCLDAAGEVTIDFNKTVPASTRA